MDYDLKIFTEDVDIGALDQIYTLMRESTFSHEKVRIMPDVHAGIGCVVGFTSTSSDKVIPNIIGVDIGCGMLTIELGKIDIDLPALDDFIHRKIPAGTAIRNESNGEDLIKSLYCYDQLRNMPRLVGSLGSLGGGNHFIEVDRDEEDNKYLIIHSGSRNLGQQVASIYQKIAISSCKTVSNAEREEVIARLKSEGRQMDIPDELRRLTEKYAYKTKIPDQLCYLDGIEKERYMHDMKICQEFAHRNREKMAEDIIKFLKIFRYEKFETVHNFIDEFNIIRKGAVPAHLGQRILIPLNMKDGCIIAIGKGNEDWNESAPHGAGRLLSRSDAKELITLDEYQKSMEGIYTTSVNNSTIDESPMAYKPAEEILQYIQPTVTIERIIKPIYNFKAGE